MTTTTHADAIYINGQVVTLDRQQPRANAVAIKDGKFLAVGAYDEVIQHHGPATTYHRLTQPTSAAGLA